MPMTPHSDTHKMRPSELRACNCPRCQDALRVHAQLDLLIESSLETDKALTRLETTLSGLERTLLR